MSTALPRSFVALVRSNLAAQSAEQLSLAAVPIVAVLALQAGPGEIGLLATVQTLPFLLLSIPLGLWADRYSRRRLMLAAEWLRALSLLGLFGLLAFGQASLLLLALLGFAGAVGTVAYSVAAPARLSRERWWPGPVRRRPSFWRRCCRYRRRCCCGVWWSQRAQWRLHAIRCWSCRTAPGWSGSMLCCARSC
jgi:MFS family permease